MAETPHANRTGLHPGALDDHKGQEAPSGPLHLSRASWLAAARRTVHEFGEDVLTDRAAALTYYAVLSIFPALLLLVSLLGLIGKSATQPMITNLSQAAPGAVRQIILQAINNLQKGHATAGTLAVVSLAGALWSASSYVAAFRRASNVIYDVPEGRPIWKTAPLRIGVTLSVMVMLVISALIVVVTGGLARHVGQVLGIGSVTMRVWGIAKWPALVLIVSVMFALLYWVSPNAKRGLRWVAPGGIFAVAAWLIASGLFAIYVANFGHYNKTYGSIAALVIFLVWLWISNIAILLGAEFNAELERSRAAAAGVPLGAEPFVEPRDLRTLRKRKRTRAGTS